MPKDIILDYMRRLHRQDPIKFPWTRETYLALNYWDSSVELDAEGESMLPKEFQLTEAEFALRHMPVPTDRLM
jgi:hypothetical protein